MSKYQKVTVALMLIFLAAVFKVNADDRLKQDKSGIHSGVAGQVILIIPALNSLNFNYGEDFSTEPIQLNMWVYAKLGHQVRYVGSFETAQDGTFSFDAPPGTYEIVPDPASEYALGGVVGQYTDSVEITIEPRQITYDEIYVVSVSDSPFPGLN